VWGLEISRSLRYFAERTPIPTFHQLHFGSKAYQQGRIQVLPFARFCSQVLEGV
jgi:hypothetical protein